MSKWKNVMIPAGLDSDGQRIMPIGLGGGKDTDTGILGYGTSSNRVRSSTADVKFIHFRLDVKASSGDNRGMYLRTYFSGGGGGESARIFSTVETNAGTVHGAHISLNFDASTKITGLGVAGRNTLHVPTGGLGSGGTYYAAQAEIYMDANDSTVAGVTKHAILSLAVSGGNATARDTVKYILAIDGVTSGASNAIQTGQGEPTWTAKTVLIRCLINGAPYAIVAVDES